MTTQVPAVEFVGVLGHAPQPMEGARASRPYSRRERGLNPHEVALLEVLRAFDDVAERPWSDLVAAVGEAMRSRRIRPDLVAEAVAGEPYRQARARWQRLAEELPAVAVV